MLVSFQTVRNTVDLGDCGICRDSLTDNGQVVDHEGAEGKRWHAVHLQCIKTWVDTNPTCPACLVPVDPSSLLSWKDRFIVELNHIKADAFVGALEGAVLLALIYAAETRIKTRGGPQGLGAAVATATLTNKIRKVAGLAGFTLSSALAVAAVVAAAEGLGLGRTAAVGAAAGTLVRVTYGFVARRGYAPF